MAIFNDLPELPAASMAYDSGSAAGLQELASVGEPQRAAVRRVFAKKRPRTEAAFLHHH
jgi:hypothetical protein